MLQNILLLVILLLVVKNDDSIIWNKLTTLLHFKKIKMMAERRA